LGRHPKHKRPNADLLDRKHACRIGLSRVLSKRLRSALPFRPVARLDQDQEPEQPGDGETSGGALVMRPPRDYGRNPIESALLDEDIALQVTDGRGGPAPMAVSANSDGQDQFEEGNAA
jgi:hypothetical protein